MVSNPDNGNYPYTNDHVQMWGTFVTIAKWVIIASVIGLVLMAAFLTGSPHAIRA
ncbi:MAG: hypothetical protein JNK67_03340 [Alphaproteobacteria bacterium]|nr:hypothetical protein [Alphaproteobacteria bacterium]